MFNGKKENDSSNISSVKVSYLASAKFHKNNFLLLITKKLLGTAERRYCCFWAAAARLAGARLG